MLRRIRRRVRAIGGGQVVERSPDSTVPQRSSRRLASAPGWILSGAVLLALAVVLVRALAPHGAMTTPDSLRYLDAAGNVHEGRGLVVDNPAAGPERVPFTTYAPLYPLTLSLFLGSDRPEHSAARLAMVALFACGMLVLLLLAPAAGRFSATLGAVTFMLAQPTLTVFAYAWSETVALPLLLASAWLCLRAIQSTGAGGAQRRATSLLLLAFALGLLIASRYAGVLFAVLVPLTWLLGDERRKWTPDTLAAGVSVAGFAGALALRNHRLTGYLSGSPREASIKGPWENVADLLGALQIQIFSNTLGTIAAVGLLAVGTAVALRSGLVRAGAVPDPATAGYRRKLALVSAVCLLIYLGGLVALRTRKELDDIDTRFIGLAVPFAVILLWLGVCASWPQARRSILAAGGLAGCLTLIGLVAAQGISTCRAAVSAWASCSSPTLALSEELVYINHNLPQRAFAERATQLLDQRRYDQAAVELRRAQDLCPESYDLEKALATAYAGMGDAENSLVHTKRCLTLDRDRALYDIVSISTPFWNEPRLYPRGVEYYLALTEELPDESWLHENIAVLAEGAGDRDLAREARSTAEAIQRRPAGKR